jgi:hypothetical protein
MPWDIGRLTDWQIEKLIFEPALKKAKDMDPNAIQEPVAPPEDTWTMPTEDEYVKGAIRFAGGTEEHWRAEYRKCVAEDAKRGNA